MKSGVYTTPKKDGSMLYRASITAKDKHISLGSFATEALAHSAYLKAGEVLRSKKDLFTFVDEYKEGKKSPLPFEKAVVLLNLRDNGVYIKTPIYLEKRSFLYLYSPDLIYTFDNDDLFYYSNHKIMKRGSHLFVADYGSQINILSRYGIKPHAVPGHDYLFVNGDGTDLRYTNIEIVNRYKGVRKQIVNGREIFVVKIHVNGDIIVGKYNDETTAAAAYNKAAILLRRKGVKIDFGQNYLDGISEIEYVALLNKVRVSESIRNYVISDRKEENQ
ncbi:MAG: hypothetical protein K6G60_10520 [Lachnospiraceae bacterium]|nr:hypothetical protein [Lachnospiraceae bacterium]